VTSEGPDGSGTDDAAASSRASSMLMLSREMCTDGSVVVSNNDTVETGQLSPLGLSGTPKVPSTRGWGGCATYGLPLASSTGSWDTRLSWPGAAVALGACATSQSPSWIPPHAAAPSASR